MNQKVGKVILVESRPSWFRFSSKIMILSVNHFKIDNFLRLIYFGYTSVEWYFKFSNQFKIKNKFDVLSKIWNINRKMCGEFSCILKF